MKHISDEEMFRLIDGEYTAEEEHTLQTHIHHCATCEKLHAEISLLELKLQHLILDSPSEQFTEQLMEKLQPVSAVQPRTFSPKQLSVSLAPIAITFALILILLSGISLGWFIKLSPAISYPISKTYDFTLLPSMLQNEWVTLICMVTVGICMLLVLDKAVLKPFFRKKFEQPTA